VGVRNIVAVVWRDHPGALLLPSLKAASIDAVAMPEASQALGRYRTVVTCFRDSLDAEEAYLGRNGLLTVARHGATLIDLTLKSPQLARELQALAMVYDCHFIDAFPVLALDDSQRIDNLFVGGDRLAYRQCLPVLKALARRVSMVGQAGDGAAAGLCTVAIRAGMVMGVVEALTLARYAGLQAQAMAEIVADDELVSAPMRHLASQIVEGSFEHGATVEAFVRQLSCAIEAADELGLALPVLDTAHQLYDLLMMVGGAKKPLHSLALLYTDEAQCATQGLDWALAQRAMDVYEQAGGYYYDDPDDEDFDCGSEDGGCGHAHD
jgi:3-hydroxyisobutyrate dehydrogenase